MYKNNLKLDLLICAALRLQEFQGSILISTLVVTQITVNIHRTLFPAPNRSEQSSPTDPLQIAFRVFFMPSTAW